jgi:hypothetical protein
VAKQEQTNVLGTIFILAISFLTMRIEVGLETLVCSPFNHMNWLVGRESVISIRLPSLLQQAPAATSSAEYEDPPMVGSSESFLRTAR